MNVTSNINTLIYVSSTLLFTRVASRIVLQGGPALAQLAKAHLSFKESAYSEVVGCFLMAIAVDHFIHSYLPVFIEASYFCAALSIYHIGTRSTEKALQRYVPSKKPERLQDACIKWSTLIGLVSWLIVHPSSSSLAAGMGVYTAGVLPFIKIEHDVKNHRLLT